MGMWPLIRGDFLVSLANQFEFMGFVLAKIVAA